MGQGDLQGQGYLRCLGIRGELRGADSKGPHPARRESPIVWYPPLGIPGDGWFAAGDQQKWEGGWPGWDAL